MGYTWARNWGSTGTTNGRFSVICGTVPIGSSLVRTVFGWNLWLLAPAWTVPLLEGQPVFAGVDTVRSGYAFAYPHPASDPLTELSYPQQRWLYWEASPLEPADDNHRKHATEGVLLRTVGTMAPRQCETAVTNIYPDQTLNVAVAVECPAVVTVGLEAKLTAYASILYTS